MSIQNSRLEQATERILKEELQKGNLPTSKEFAWRLSEYLNEQDLSRPEFVFRSVKNGTLAYASKYNEDFQRIHNDLSILYKNMQDVHSALGKHFSKFEIEKDIIEKEIYQIENNLREKILMYAQGGFLTAVFDVFDDFGKVDKTQTENVLIDTKNHEVRLAEELTLSERIGTPAKTTFTLTSNVVKKQTTLNGKIEDVHEMFADKNWQQLVQTKEKTQLTGEVLMDFEGKVQMNQLVVSFINIKPMNVLITYTPDDINWVPFSYHEQAFDTATGFDITFASVGVRKLKVTMKKEEFDEQVPDVEGYDYRYVFGIRKIEMRHLRFPENGVLQSLPLKVEGPANYAINKVSLDVNEMLPTGTDIFYEVALASETPEWRGISPLKRENPAFPQIIDFQNISRSKPTTMQIGTELAVNQYELPELKTNGISFYKIGDVTGRHIIEGSERLFVGRNAWECKFFDGTFELGHVPSLEDWNTPLNEIKYEYEQIDETRRSLLFKNKVGPGPASYYCRAGVLYAGSQSIITMTPSTTEPIAVFINGEKIYEGIGAGKANAQFVQGWNEIVVLVYGENRGTVNGMTVDLGLDLLREFENMYISPTPMTKVELFDLRFNTKISDRSKYSVRKTDESYEVLMNFAETGLVFDFYYDFAVNGNEGNKTVLLRARFVRKGDDTIPSPVLKKYRLQFS